MAKKRRQPHAGAAKNCRRLGTRIKRGLDQLSNLDAVTKQSTPKHDSTRLERNKRAVKSSKRTQGPSSRDKVASGSVSQSKAITTSVHSCGHSVPLSSSASGCGWREWMHIKERLFDQEVGCAGNSGRRQALDHIERVWKARARPNRPLPSYVETTLLLLEAVTHDEENRLSPLAAVMLYGAAISRAVHIMTGSFASGTDDTYRKRARAIEFPEEAVEVRQRVAHGTVPLLTELRWVCGLVLQFLFQKYWIEQEQHLVLLEGHNWEEEEEEEEEGNAIVEETSSLETPHATVGEMRALLEELSDDDEDGNDDALNSACQSEAIEVGGWKLL
ncbi:putative Las1 like [Trypanosoma vivax]|uniref:Las1-like n=1 Tax=Trypanosoma vivax (strain Y486) TaxID=1055687 RepID=G0U1G9_TRYVY|nr:hypothetical protein TRVL_00746 [Trypanosoma vivax]KAH8608910.1 putative Las1 like [Trypanosoma vivax]CCC49925.1 conserved hypothetical protein [Trypanosoma vivax Y486]